MLGEDFQLPEGYQLAEGVDQVTNIQVPFGATAGHTMIVEAVPSETVETVLNVTFETIYGEKVGETTASTTAVGGEGEAWTFMLGTDFQLPEGYQLAEGVDQVTNIQVPFGATGGHTMIVEKIQSVDPVDPVDPGDPVDPVEPTDPTEPTTPDDTKKDDNKADDKNNSKVDNTKADKTANKAKKAEKKAENAETPQTGDSAHVVMNILVMAICAAAIVTVICRKRHVR